MASGFYDLFACGNVAEIIIFDIIGLRDKSVNFRFVTRPDHLWNASAAHFIVSNPNAYLI